MDLSRSSLVVERVDNTLNKLKYKTSDFVNDYNFKMI